MVPARERAARHGRAPQIETLEPGFFDSSFGQETPPKSEKQNDYKFGKVKIFPAKASPVVESVEIEKADHVLVSTGLNGANPGLPGYYDQPSTYSTDNGPLMPYEISQGVYDLVATATRLGVHTHVSAGQSAATYRYDGTCATEWQHAAEKMCHNLKEDSTLSGTFVIDTCADSEREGIRTRADLGHSDSWHFALDEDTCQKAMFHEIDKLKYMECMFIYDEQMEGWIKLLELGCSSSSASSLTAASGSADNQPESLGKLTSPCIPFTTTFIEGHTLGTDANATSIYRSSDSDAPTTNVDVPSGPVS